MARHIEAQHLGYLDCTRGYAILMVMVCHATYSYPGLPWPVARVTTTGWFGVQLFFLASAVTLLMSWQAQRQVGARDLRGYAIRRLFRIAPAYYLAAMLYLVVSPPAHFSWAGLLSALTFTNSWSPTLLTGPAAWAVVPGSWSISVEMSFYVVFPLYAAWATSLPRALVALVVAVLVGLGANLLVVTSFGAVQADAGLGNFLFFWLPNQLSVFAVGGVLFHLLPLAQSSRFLRRCGPLVATAALGAFWALAYRPWPHFIGDGLGVPSGLAAALVLSLFVLALSVRGSLYNNAWVASLGRVSFSAYLLHWAVLRAFALAPGVLGLNATGVAAIAVFCVGLLILIPATYVLALVSSRFVEQPMMRVGKRLIGTLPSPRAAVLAR